MAERTHRLLVVDDERGMLALVDRFARGEGFAIITRTGGRAILSELPALRPDVALLDRNMPEVGGLDILRLIREIDPDCQVILMTADATPESALEAVKLGALDYLKKPIDFTRLRELLQTVRYSIERRQRLLTADGDVASRFEFCGMIGRSPVMQELFDAIRRLAPHARTSLVTGEPGSGKRLVARALHRLGPRNDRPFIAVDCAASAERLESELSGLADGSTLFLDEVGELSPPAQAALLRAVESDVRIIAASDRQLFDQVVAGRFDQALYYRLAAVEINVPSLRERPDDIPYLTAAFIREFGTRFARPLGGVSPGAERLLHNAPWPGNVGELRHVIERACLLSDGCILSERDVLSVLGTAPPRPARRAEASVPPATGEAEPAADPRVVEQVLQQLGGNRSAASRLLGISRRALSRRLDTFAAHRDRDRTDR